MVVNDSLVASQVYSFIYLSEYAFFFIVFAMAYILLDRFVKLHSDFEELNINLEHNIRERTSKIRKLNKDLKRIAERDGLTGVYNRRFFNEYLEIEMRRARSHREYISHLESGPEVELNFGLAIIDIDHFKQINDKYGHLVGDTILKQTTDIINHIKFPRDILCRYGGDEFVLLLTKTSSRGNLKAMEKIRREIDQQVFIVGTNHTNLHITISVGLANYNEIPDQGSEEILKLADDRLLRAKNLGRNRVVHSESD
jgi:diguanylate cyclase (GGDEF)-like protein